MNIMNRAAILASGCMLWSAASFGSVTVDSNEGRIEVNGYGEASHAPEYARLQISVASICYDTAQESKNANAQLANQLLGVINQFAKSKREKVYATGGYNVRQTETYGAGESYRVLCQNKWRSTNTLILETTQLDQLPEIQDQVLATIDKFQLDPQKVAQTYAELYQPSFGLFKETRAALRKQAQAKAYKDARDQLEGFEAVCNFENTELKSIRPPRTAFRPVFRAAEAAEASTTTPIIPQEINVSVEWQFVWTFDPAASCDAI